MAVSPAAFRVGSWVAVGTAASGTKRSTGRSRCCRAKRGTGLPSASPNQMIARSSLVNVACTAVRLGTVPADAVRAHARAHTAGFNFLGPVAQRSRSPRRQEPSCPPAPHHRAVTAERTNSEHRRNRLPGGIPTGRPDYLDRPISVLFRATGSEAGSREHIWRTTLLDRESPQGRRPNIDGPRDILQSYYADTEYAAHGSSRSPASAQNGRGHVYPQGGGTVRPPHFTDR